MNNQILTALIEGSEFAHKIINEYECPEALLAVAGTLIDAASSAMRINRNETVNKLKEIGETIDGDLGAFNIEDFKKDSST